MILCVARPGAPPDRDPKCGYGVTQLRVPHRGASSLALNVAIILSAERGRGLTGLSSHTHRREERRRPPERLLGLGDQAADDLAHRQHLADKAGTLARKRHVLVKSSFRQGRP